MAVVLYPLGFVSGAVGADRLYGSLCARRGGRGPLGAPPQAHQAAPAQGAPAQPAAQPSITRRSLPDGVDGLLNEIRHASTAWAQQNNAHPCLDKLDICGCIDDAGTSKLFEVLASPHVAIKRLKLSGNKLTDSSMTAIAEYMRHSPEPMRELVLECNQITDTGVEELLRCLYNHPCHPPRLPPSAGSPGHVFPLRLDLRNNFIADQEGLVALEQSFMAGGPGSVKICVTPGDGPVPPPVAIEANRQIPSLFCFLPRFADQPRMQQPGACMPPGPDVPAPLQNDSNQRAKIAMERVGAAEAQAQDDMERVYEALEGTLTEEVLEELLHMVRENEEKVNVEQTALTKDINYAWNRESLFDYNVLRVLRARLRDLHTKLNAESASIQGKLHDLKQQDEEAAVEKRDAKAFQEVLPVAMDIVRQAEDAVEEVAVFALSLSAEDEEELGEDARQTMEEIADAANKAQSSLAHARKTITKHQSLADNFAPQTRKLARQQFGELLDKLTQAQKKLIPLKRIQQDCRRKRKASGAPESMPKQKSRRPNIAINVVLRIAQSSGSQAKVSVVPHGAPRADEASGTVADPLPPAPLFHRVPVAPARSRASPAVPAAKRRVFTEEEGATLLRWHERHQEDYATEAALWAAAAAAGIVEGRSACSMLNHWKRHL